MKQYVKQGPRQVSELPENSHDAFRYKTRSKSKV